MNLHYPVHHHHHHHHHIVPPARISLTLSRHFSLTFIAPGRSSGLYPVSSQICFYVCLSWPSCFCLAICGERPPQHFSVVAIEKGAFGSPSTTVANNNNNGVMVIVIENGHGNTSSNPGRNRLHFALHEYPWERYESNYSPSSYG